MSLGNAITRIRSKLSSVHNQLVEAVKGGTKRAGEYSETSSGKGVTWLLAVVAAIAAVIALAPMLGDLTAPRGLSTDFANIDSSGVPYLLESEGDAPLHPVFSTESYPAFNDEIGDEKVSYFSSSCATQVTITNHDETATNITGVRLVAERITPDLRAELDISFDYFPDDKSPYSVFRSLALSVTNTGWLDGTNLTCRVTCNDDGFTRCFGSDSLEWECPDVPIGTSQKVPFLNADNLIEAPEENTDFEVTVEIFSEQGSEHGSMKSLISITAYPNGGVDWTIKAGGMEGERPVYGIKIDTNKTSDVFEDSTSLVVEGNGIRVVPVCFFADRSCTVLGHFEFTDTNGNVVRTPSAEMYLDISSIPYTTTYDVRDLTAEEYGDLLMKLEQNPSFGLVSFPFTGFEYGRSL